MTDQEEKKHNPCEIEWYAAGLAAWYGTRLEHDKSLLTLAAGGIGLLISLVSAFGVESVESLILFTLALAAFILCVSAVLWIFKRNSKHIEDAVGQQKGNDPVLAVLDNVAVSTFLAGVVLSSILGIAVAVHSFETKRTSMSVEKKTTGPVVVIGDSVNGINNMSPAGLAGLRRSFNGIANMAPASQEGSVQSPAAQPATQTNGAGSSQTTMQSNTKAK
jgi:hypothetical protein